MSKMRTYFLPFEAILVEEAILSLLDSATKTIHLALYGFTDEKMCNKLIELSTRGVDIKAVMDATEASTARQKVLLEKMLNAGITVAVGRSPVNSQLLHSKMIIVDSKSVEWGSMNYSPSGLQQFNFCSFQEDEVLAAQFLEAWCKIYQHILEKDIAKFWDTNEDTFSLQYKVCRALQFMGRLIGVC